MYSTYPLYLKRPLKSLPINHQVNFENALVLLHSNILHLLRLHGHDVFNNSSNHLLDISPLFNTLLPQTNQYLGRCFKVADNEEVVAAVDNEKMKHKFEVLQMKPQYLRRESSLSSNNNNNAGAAVNGTGNGAQVVYDSNDVKRRVRGISFEELNDDDDSKG